jgi:hypothetical protein
MSLNHNKRWTTHRELRHAPELNAYRLAAAWGDVTTWPATPDRDTTDELEELAVMSTLRDWLQSWQPLQAHRALLAGATPTTVADAMGIELTELAARWRKWADGQRNLHQRTGLGLNTDEYDRVAQLLTDDLKSCH